MELNNIFSLETLGSEDGNLLVRAVIDRKHWVYEAHFPDKPITPGAVILQTLQDIVGQALSRKYKISEISSVRFFTPVEPGKVGSIDFQVEILPDGSDSVAVKCTVVSGETKFSKIKAKLTSCM